MALPKPRKPDRRNLWPRWCRMTIGIGVVSSIQRKGDCLILASDRLGSYGDYFSTKNFGKMFCIEDQRIFAVCAGTVQHAGELIPMIAEGWRGIPTRNLQLLTGKLAESVLAYKHHRFYLDVLPKYDISPKDDWRSVGAKTGMLKILLKEWRQFSIDCEIIIGTFDDHGHVHTYSIDSYCSITLRTLDNFCAIGTGSFQALFWLSYREHNLGMSAHRSCYHAYEAKLMAETSPHVGKDDVILLVATWQKYWVLAKEQPELEGCPVSLTKLAEEFGDFGPKSTESLEVL